MAAIQAAVEASDDEAAAEDRAWAREVIGRQARQLSRLIEELLDISRISHGEIQRDLIARGIFSSKDDLRRKIMRYLRQYNRHATPFNWTYKNSAHRLR